MRRLALLLALLSIVAVGCGSTPSPAPHPAVTTKLTFPETTGPACQPRNPPAMGECVAQHFGLTQPEKIEQTKVGVKAGGECADISQWQGYSPNLTGLKCVIIQASYGLTVEPSVYSQIEDANEHHVPWGAYGFQEGYSGAAEARLTVSVTNGRGRKLGVWADAEVGPAYSHACEFTREAHALGAHIYGLFAAPGMYPAGDGRCAGWLWPSEWEVPAAYPFAGYPSSAIKLWQDCGRCYRYGVQTDRDVDEGLVALAKAKPKPFSPSQRKRLVAYWTRQRAAVLHRYHDADCKAWSTGPKCTARRRLEHTLWADIERLK